MFRVKLNGVEVECDNTKELRELLYNKKTERTQTLEYDVNWAEMTRITRLNPSKKGVRNLYSEGEKRRIIQCKKTSELVATAKEFGRTPLAVINQWYSLTQGGK